MCRNMHISVTFDSVVLYNIERSGFNFGITSKVFQLKNSLCFADNKYPVMSFNVTGPERRGEVKPVSCCTRTDTQNGISQCQSMTVCPCDLSLFPHRTPQ